MQNATGSVNSLSSQLSALDYPTNIVFDGKFHRFKRTKKDSGWYVGHMVQTDRGPYPVVVCGDWVTGERHRVTPQIPWSERDQEKIRVQLERLYEQEGRLRAEKAAFAAEQARELWELAEPDRQSSYMTRKGFDSNWGARVDREGTLLIPMMIGEELHGIERVYADGSKYFLPGQRFKGTYFTIGKLSKESLAYLCEGFATGVSIHLATGRPVIVGFAADNLIDVANAFAGYKITVCADNDRFTEGNPGITKAQKVAAAHGWQWIAPHFPEGPERYTDFNDLHLSQGIDAVTRQLIGIEVVEHPISQADEKPRKPVQAEIFEQLATHISHKLGCDFLVTCPDGETRVILERDRETKTVHRVAAEYVVALLLTHLRQYHGVKKEYCLTPKQAKECVDYWSKVQPLIPMPKPYAFSTDLSETFHRLPFDLIDDGSPTPTFDMILNRTGKEMAKTIRYWIGSIFVPDSDRSVYLWWYGEGGDGKGSIIRVLGRVLGKAHLGTQAPSSEGERRFWKQRLFGKRLVTLGECNNYAFPMTDVFKAITGGDILTAEFKNKDGFDFTPECLVFIASNERTAMSGTKANLRRCLYAESQPRPDNETVIPQKVMDARLWAEAPTFIARCKNEYLAKYPDRGAILMPDESAAQLAELNEERWAALTDKYFVQGGDEILLSTDWMQYRSDEKLNEVEHRHWREWLRRRWKIEPYRTNTIRGWKGLRKKTAVERVPLP